MYRSPPLILHFNHCLNAIDRESTGLGGQFQGSIDLTFLKWGQRILFDPPTSNVYKTCFLPRLSHCHTPSTPFTPSFAHIMTLSCRWPILLSQSTAESVAASISLPKLREPFVNKSLGQNCTLFGVKTKGNFAPKCPILHIKFPKKIWG